MKETRQGRIERWRGMKQTMTLQEIADLEGFTRSWISQNIGRTRDGTNPILFEVHRYIVDIKRESGNSPTMEEIAAAFPSNGKPRSTSVIAYWLNQMEEHKLIKKRKPRLARSIQPLRIRK